VSPKINSLESLFDKEGLREFGARGLKMEAYQDIRFNVSDGVAVIELHRPDHLNAYSCRMGVELGDSVEAQPDEGLAGVAGFAGSKKAGVAWM
jgi:1,4-dihydroxy-2-naphthoyl-CoA synthase